MACLRVLYCNNVCFILPLFLNRKLENAKTTMHLLQSDTWLSLLDVVEKWRASSFFLFVLFLFVCFLEKHKHRQIWWPGGITVSLSSLSSTSVTHRTRSLGMETYGRAPYDERGNIWFRFINSKLKHACRQRDSSSQSVIVEVRRAWHRDSFVLSSLTVGFSHSTPARSRTGILETAKRKGGGIKDNTLWQGTAISLMQISLKNAMNSTENSFCIS